MGTRLFQTWDAIRSSFWFLPAVMTLAAIALSFLTVSLDRALSANGDSPLGWTYRGGADGARAVLSTIAASMITVAGVVFSITMVTLSLASNQFGPRLLRNFIRDRGNQFVLGTFVATFVFCLLALRTVSGTEDRTFVPEVSITTGVILALVSLGVLIYFIHHIAQSIQASNVVARVAGELHAAIDALYPEELGEDADLGPPDAVIPPPATAQPIEAAENGYVLGVDADALMREAVKRDLVIHLAHPPGRFVICGDDLMRVEAAGRLDDDGRVALRKGVVIGSVRTGVRDIDFVLQQLTEVAIRALSPSVNDPFTAVECIHRLGETFARLAGRKFPPPYRLGADGRVRVVAPGFTFPEMLTAAVDPIRHHGRASPRVLESLCTTLAAIARRCRRSADRAAIDHLAGRLLRAADDLADPHDRDRVTARAEAVRTAVRQPPSRGGGVGLTGDGQPFETPATVGEND